MDLWLVAKIVGLVISHSVVAALAMAWGKAHPAIQSKVAEGVGKIESKL
jgi:hypothetical protein